MADKPKRGNRPKKCGGKTKATTGVRGKGLPKR
jgi:hypothetical protein